MSCMGLQPRPGQVMHTMGWNIMALLLKIYLKHTAKKVGPVKDFDMKKFEIGIGQERTIV